MLYAVVAMPLSWRAILSSTECVPGEVAVDSIPDGVNSDNSVWDATLNDGDGGVRLMTADELAVVAAAQAAVVTSENSVITSLDTFYSMMTENPPITLSATQLRSCLVGILLALKSITGKS